MTAPVSQGPKPVGRLPNGSGSFRGSLYGMRLALDFTLPGIAATDDERLEPDLQILETDSESADWCFTRPRGRDGDFAIATLEDGREWLIWPDYIEFLIDPAGTTIQYRKFHSDADRLLENFFVHHVISRILVRRGIESFHGTVLVRDGQAIGLLGDCGFGKSTLAAALIKVGYSPVTDDLIVPLQHEDRVFCRTGVPRLKLLTDAKEFFSPAHASAVECNGKWIVHFDSRTHVDADVPITTWYFLRPPQERSLFSAAATQKMPGAAIFAGLVANTYNLMLASPERLAAHMRYCGGLAHSICARSVAIPEGMNFVAEAAALIGKREREGHA